MADKPTAYERYTAYCNRIGVPPATEQMWAIQTDAHLNDHGQRDKGFGQ